MAFDLKNKIVLITGAATGIGALVVRNLIQEEVKLIAVLDVNEEAGNSLKKELNSKCGLETVKFIKCDVSAEDQLLGAYQTILDENGSIDIVINNAGIMNDSLTIYKKAIELNFTALVTSTLKAYEIMRKDCGGKGGTIINISSVAALCQNPVLPIYFGTKSAVLQFTNCAGMPEYYSRTGVRVITVCFGATDTPLLSMEKMGCYDKILENKILDIVKEFPLQRPESAARGVIDVCKQAESGSTWLSTHDEPARDITATVKKAYSILASEVFY